MNLHQTLQASMDSFVQHLSADEEASAQSEICLETLAQYLIHYSDLFQDQELGEDAEFVEWEHELEEHMVELLHGDLEPASDLGQLPLSALDPEHIRDFIGWFLLRETSDAELIESYADILRQWVQFIHERNWWEQADYLGFIEILGEITPAATRAARLSRVLYHYVRSGGGMPPRLRGKQFSRFIEGHGRVISIEDQALQLSFDNQDEKVGPIRLPRPICEMVETGDVFDVEMGLRGDTWVMVDIGPVYPASIYVEVEEYHGLEKVS